MTNEEMQRVLEFTMQRREVFAEGMEQLKGRQVVFQSQLEDLNSSVARLGVNVERLEANQNQLQADMSEMARAITRLGGAQEQTQSDISNLTKIAGNLLELVARERGGDAR